LVYGENNAGKSALLRLPSLLAESRAPGEPGLALGGASFRDVQWRGKLDLDADPDLVLGVSLGGATWRWTLRWNALSATPSLVQAQLAGNDIGSLESFDGILPPSGAVAPSARTALIEVLRGVTWLRARREAPSRSGTPRGAVGAGWRNPEGLARQVAADARLRAGVSRWYENHARVRVEVEPLGPDMERLTLAPLDGAFAVPFSDAGEGLQATFSVLAALEQLRENGGLLCVEEPESHLHPRLQRALAASIVDVLVAQPKASVILETHSEIFLLSALTAALNKLQGGAVQLQWVSLDHAGAARVDAIAIDELGHPESDRLEHAFAVMGVMRRELVHARKNHGG